MTQQNHFKFLLLLAICASALQANEEPVLITALPNVMPNTSATSNACVTALGLSFGAACSLVESYFLTDLGMVQYAFTWGTFGYHGHARYKKAIDYDDSYIADLDTQLATQEQVLEKLQKEQEENEILKSYKNDLKKSCAEENTSKDSLKKLREMAFHDKEKENDYYYFRNKRILLNTLIAELKKRVADQTQAIANTNRLYSEYTGYCNDIQFNFFCSLVAGYIGCNKLLARRQAAKIAKEQGKKKRARKKWFRAQNREIAKKQEEIKESSANTYAIKPYVKIECAWQEKYKEPISPHDEQPMA